MKTCTTCGQTKPLAEFYRRSDSPDGYRNQCKECKRAAQAAYDDAHREERRAYSEQYRREHPDAWKDWAARNQDRLTAYSRTREADPARRLAQADRQYRRKYGLTLDEVTAWRAELDYTCPTCHRHEDEVGKLCVDHDHATGEVRGLLCPNCNTALGLVGDDPATLRALIAHLDA